MEEVGGEDKKRKKQNIKSTMEDARHERDEEKKRDRAGRRGGFVCVCS